MVKNMIRVMAIVLVLFATHPVWAQVSNDKVANRIRLEADALPLHTTTASSTVEWGCLNQALTDKCLVYHNDQWYSFQVKEPQAYFLNISRLTCRNTKGIQLILIEGNPCETKNYRVIQCIRQIQNEDVFVPLGMVVANMTYLIEIDGFDGDHCDFDIQISRRPSGLPMQFEELLKSEARVSVATQTDSLVNILWKVPAGQLTQIDEFRVYRLKERDVFRLARAVPTQRNAYGNPVDSYSIKDTLTTPGNYLYRVLGYPVSGQPVLLTEARVTYAKKKKLPPVTQTIRFFPPFNQKTEYAVRVYEMQQLSVLHAFNGSYDPASPKPIEIDVKQFISKGYGAYMVVLINKATQETLELYYRIDARGSVVEDK